MRIFNDCTPAGDVISCEKCNHIWIRRNFSEKGKELFLLDEIVPQEELNLCEFTKKDFNKYYLSYTGICQECVQNYHYHFLSDEEETLIDLYLKQAENFRFVDNFITRAIHRFNLNLTSLMVEVNPEAFEQYKQNYSQAPAEEKLSLAERYVEEIKPDLITWIQKDANMRMNSSEKRNAKRMKLLELEAQVQELLSKTEACGGYCETDPFSQIQIVDGVQPVQQLKNLCKGKQLTSDEFYFTCDGLKETLQSTIYDTQKHKTEIDEAAVTANGDFQWLLELLPEKLTSKYFWRFVH